MVRMTLGRMCLGSFLVSCFFISSCKKSEETSTVKDIGCLGNYLGQFVEGIPLPGFSLLGKLGSKLVGNVAGIIRGHAANEVKGNTCGTPASFSEMQMQQMKQAIKEGFSEQNHMEAKALMNKIDMQLTEFVADEDRYSDYTMNSLKTIIDDVNTWWSKYDQSGTKIYNVQDFVIVSGFAMKAYQQQIRQVALEASKTRSAGDAKKVREYAENLARKADHARREIEGMSNNDIIGIAEAFWKDNGKKQSKKFMSALVFAHCYESATGQPYNDFTQNESQDQRTQNFLNRMRSTNTLGELSDYVRANGTVCCMDGNCGNLNIEKRIQVYKEETIKQVKKVMFYNNPAIMKYYDETLPLFTKVSQLLKDAPDEIIFQLAENKVYSGENLPVVSDSGGSCPDGSNGPGKGYGSIYTCGSKQCAKSDAQALKECVVSTGAPSAVNVAGGCPDGDNGPGKGYGEIFQCGDKKCAKTDKSYQTQCVLP